MKNMKNKTPYDMVYIVTAEGRYYNGSGQKNAMSITKKPESSFSREHAAKLVVFLFAKYGQTFAIKEL